jgi:hypothetical protein
MATNRIAIEFLRAAKRGRKIRELRRAAKETEVMANARKAEAAVKLTESKELATLAEAAEAKKIEAAAKVREAKRVLGEAESAFQHADQVLMAAEQGTISHTSVEVAKKNLEIARQARDTAKNAFHAAEAESASAVEEVRVATRAAEAARADAVHADSLALHAEQTASKAKENLAKGAFGGGAAAVTLVPETAEAAQNTSEQPYPITETVMEEVVEPVGEVLDIPIEIAARAVDGLLSPITPNAGHRALAYGEEKLTQAITSETAAPVVDPLFSGLGKGADGIDKSFTVAGKAIWKGVAPIVTAVVPGGGAIDQVLEKIEKVKSGVNIGSGNIIKDNRAIWAKAAAAGRKAIEESKEIQNFTPTENFTSDTTEASQEICQSVNPGVAASTPPKISP